MRSMSTIRIDDHHRQLLDRLLAHLLLRGKKINKKDLLGTLIEKAIKEEGIPLVDTHVPIEEDSAWTGLNETFKLDIVDLSENVDTYLYKMDGEE